MVDMREAESEGSWRQSTDPGNTNLIKAGPYVERLNKRMQIKERIKIKDKVKNIVVINAIDEFPQIYQP